MSIPPIWSYEDSPDPPEFVLYDASGVVSIASFPYTPEQKEGTESVVRLAAAAPYLMFALEEALDAVGSDHPTDCEDPWCWVCHAHEALAVAGYPPAIAAGAGEGGMR